MAKEIENWEWTRFNSPNLQPTQEEKRMAHEVITTIRENMPFVTFMLKRAKSADTKLTEQNTHESDTKVPTLGDDSIADSHE